MLLESTVSGQTVHNLPTSVLESLIYSLNPTYFEGSVISVCVASSCMLQIGLQFALHELSMIEFVDHISVMWCTRICSTLDICVSPTVVAKSFRTPRFFPLNPIVNKSCKIECCGNKMNQIIQNTILSQGLELKLSPLWRTTIWGQHPLF